MPKPHEPMSRPSSSPINWEERLRASMEAAPEEIDTPSIPDDEDDLAAMLRAELAKSTQTSHTLNIPDTGEFEDDFDDLPSEELGDEADDLPPEELDAEADGLPPEELDAEADDLPPEELDAEADDLPPEELDAEADDLPPEELGDEADDISPEELGDEADDLPPEELGDEADDLPPEELDAEADDLPPEELGDEADDIPPEGFPTEELFDESKPETVPPSPSAPLRRATVRSDALLNAAPEGAFTEDVRLRSLSEANARLLGETDVAIDESEQLQMFSLISEVSSSFADDALPEYGTDTPTGDVRRRAPSVAADPLQIDRQGRQGRPKSVAKSTRREVIGRLDEDVPVGAAVRSRAARKATRKPPAPAMTYAPAEAAANAPDSEHCDTDLYIRLGYEDELKHTEQQAQVEGVYADRRAAEPLTPAHEPAPAARDTEYHGRPDTDTAEKRYRHARRARLAYGFVALFGTLSALLYDLLPTLLTASAEAIDFGETFDGLMAFTSSSAYPLVGIALLLAVSLPFFTRLGRGLVSLFAFAPARYAVPTLSILVSAGYAGLTLLCGDMGMPLLCAPALATLTVAAFAEFFAVRGEHRAFGIVAAGKSAYVLTNDETPATALSAAKGSAGEHRFTVSVTERVDGFFARSGRYNPYMARLNYLLPFSCIAALLAAGLTLLLSDAAEDALIAEGLRAFTAAYLTAQPAAYLLAMSLPLDRANRCIADKGTAVIGAAAPSEYAAMGGKSTTRIFVRDGDAVIAVHRKEIVLRGDDRADEWRRLASRLFRVLRSPLDTEALFEDDDMSTLHAEILETDVHYQKLHLINDRPEGCETVEVMMGSHDALVRRGVRLPKITMEQTYKKSENSHVLYLAFDGCFRIAYAAEYRVSRSFSRTAAALTRRGYRLSLVTYDPMLDADRLAEPRFAELRRYELVRPTAVEPVGRIRSSGVVALGSASDLLYPLTACRRMECAYRIAHVLAWLGLGLGTALSLVGLLPAVESGWLPLLLTAEQTIAAFLSVWVTAALMRPVTFAVTDKSTNPETAVSNVSNTKKPPKAKRSPKKKKPSKEKSTEKRMKASPASPPSET